MIAPWVLVVVFAAFSTLKLHRPCSNEQTLLAGFMHERCVEETPWTHQNPEAHGSDRQDAMLGEFKTTKVRKYQVT